MDGTQVEKNISASSKCNCFSTTNFSFADECNIELENKYIQATSFY